MKLASGTLLQGGKYRIIKPIGRGGFGVTYLAEHIMAKNNVCIKEFFPKDYYKRDGDANSISLSSEGFAESMGRFKAKFIKEAQTIITLRHHNIIPIHDIFEENNTAYYVMDYIDGESLGDIVKRRGSMDERDAVAYIRQVAAALDYIHSKQVMHLDVKPGNIMIRKEDNRAILIDFGLSKHYDATSGDATSTTPVGVSHGYAPIEQYQQGGVRSFSPETDIYSLGATLYYLVTGLVPPQATAIGRDGIGNIPAYVSPSISNAIKRSMSYWKEDRPHTINELMTLLDSDEPVIKVLVDDDEKTKIAAQAPAPKPESKQEVSALKRESKQEASALKRESNKEKPKPKRSRWWLWLLSLLIIGGGAWFLIGEIRDKKYAHMIAQGLGRDGVYRIGDYYNRDGKEGVVFEIWDGGRHGKIVSLNHSPERLQWCVDEEHDEDAITGSSNTEYEYSADVWCSNEGDDWYLPSIAELGRLQYNRKEINETLATHGTEIGTGYLWSSTEYQDDAESSAWYIHMYNGDTYYGSKTDAHYVRAVARF